MQLVRDDIMPYAKNMPADFVIKLMNILNRGSIHSATSSAFIGMVHLNSELYPEILISEYNSPVEGIVTRPRSPESSKHTRVGLHHASTPIS